MVLTQMFNRTHNRAGHVFQGRFKGILVEKDSYLLELARYIVLNPVRAGMVRSAKDWAWSSYRATAGQCQPHPLLTTAWILGKRAIQLTQVPPTCSVSAYDHCGETKRWDRLSSDPQFFRLMQHAVAMQPVSYQQIVENHDHKI